MPRYTIDDALRLPILPWEGAGGVLLRNSGDDLVRALGAPSERAEVVPAQHNVPYTPVLRYRYGPMVFMLHGGFAVYQIALVAGYLGTTGDGVGVGTRMLDVVARWGLGKFYKFGENGLKVWSCEQYPYLDILPQKDAGGEVIAGAILLTDRRPIAVDERDPLPKNTLLETKKRGLRKKFPPVDPFSRGTPI